MFYGGRPIFYLERVALFLRIITMAVRGGFFSENYYLERAALSLYADDLVLFINPTTEDLTAIKEALLIFGTALRLFMNMEKCVVTPICCFAEHTTVITELFGSSITDFPCRYLGVPLSVHRLRIQMSSI